MKNYKKLTSLAAGALFFASTALSAQTVLIDWSLSNDFETSLAGGSDSNGNYWNSLGDAGPGNDIATTALTASNNTASGWSVEATVQNNLSGGTNQFSGSGFGGTAINGNTGPNPFDITGDDRPTIDGNYVNNNTDGTFFFTFTGLAASTDYVFEMIGGRASGGVDGVIQILQGTPDSNAQNISVSNVSESGSAADSYNLLNDPVDPADQVLSFTATSTASGLIEFQFYKGNNTDGNSGGSIFNAMSISAVPEPSAFALLAGMFGLTWVMLRRRA